MYKGSSSNSTYTFRMLALAHVILAARNSSTVFNPNQDRRFFNHECLLLSTPLITFPCKMDRNKWNLLSFLIMCPTYWSFQILTALTTSFSFHSSFWKLCCLLDNPSKIFLIFYDTAAFVTFHCRFTQRSCFPP